MHTLLLLSAATTLGAFLGVGIVYLGLMFGSDSMVAS